MANAVTKWELVKAIASNTNLKQKDVYDTLQGFLDEVVENMAAGRRIELRDFGVFSAKNRKARTARNPRTGKNIHIEERMVPHFKPGRLMREAVENSEVEK